MKALTLWQPWASLVSIGIKTIETRSWKTNYRGSLAIHSAKKEPSYPSLEFYEKVRIAFQHSGYSFVLLRGYVIATCELIDVFPVEQYWHMLKDDPHNEYFGNWEAGRFGWELSNVKMFEIPIKAKGSQGLWEWKIPG